MKPKLPLIRKVRYWVRYRPRSKLLIASYRTKKQATTRQLPGEAVFDVIGFYAPSAIKPTGRRA